MAKENLLSIKILNLPGGSTGCACGNVGASPEFVALLNQKIEELRGALEENYPGMTSVAYVDLNQSPTDKESEIGRLLVNKEYPPPLIVINGEAKFAGSINTNKIVKEVGKILNS